MHHVMLPPPKRPRVSHGQCCSLRQMKKQRKALQKGGAEQVGACVYLCCYSRFGVVVFVLLFFHVFFTFDVIFTPHGNDLTS